MECESRIETEGLFDPDKEAAIEADRERYRFPKLIAKYKGIVEIKELERVIDTLEESRLYMPTYDQLNDPLEGTGIKLSYGSDKERDDARKEWRILAFSETAFSPPLWAHYAKEYKGICLVYWTDDEKFAELQPVAYVKYKQSKLLDPEIDREEVFFKKNWEWRYEQEWRILRQDSAKDFFFDYAPTDLAAVILGYDLSDYAKKQIYRVAVSNNIPIFTICPHEERFLLMAKDDSGNEATDMSSLYELLLNPSS